MPNLYLTNLEKYSYAEISIDKEFSIESAALEPGTYEYRALVVHPSMRVYGYIKLVKNEK